MKEKTPDDHNVTFKIIIYQFVSLDPCEKHALQIFKHICTAFTQRLYKRLNQR